MIFGEQTIRAAFDEHWRVYVDVQGKGWTLAARAEYYRLAQAAFDPRSPSSDAFARLYHEIGWGWQAFRPGYKPNWSEAETYQHLCALPGDLRGRTLTALDEVGLREVRLVTEEVSGIKRTASGPSVVALSKFLHFWNPSLFVIVDSIVRGCLSRLGSSQRANPARCDSSAHTPEPLHLVPKSGGHDVPSYVEVLRWSGKVLRRNPTIMPCFAEYIGRKGGVDMRGLPVERYEASAIMCLLLGLARIPPGDRSAQPYSDGRWLSFPNGNWPMGVSQCRRSCSHSDRHVRSPHAVHGHPARGRQQTASAAPRAGDCGCGAPRRCRSLASSPWYLRAFGEPGADTSWYQNILEVRVMGDTVEAVVDLHHGDRTKLSSICGALSGYVYANTKRHLGLHQVKIVDVEGFRLVHRRSISDPCLPPK